MTIFPDPVSDVIAWEANPFSTKTLRRLMQIVLQPAEPGAVIEKARGMRCHLRAEFSRKSLLTAQCSMQSIRSFFKSPILWSERAKARCGLLFLESFRLMFKPCARLIVGMSWNQIWTFGRLHPMTGRQRYAFRPGRMRRKATAQFACSTRIVSGVKWSGYRTIGMKRRFLWLPVSKS